MTLRVPRTDAFGGANFATSRLRIPWTPDEGLVVVDQFGGAAPLEVPLPDALVARGTFPYVILSCFDGNTAFLAQRWFDRPVVAWELLGEVGVDSASVCLAPRTSAHRVSGKGLAEAEQVVHESPDFWAQVAVDARPLLGVRTTLGDGAYPLLLALDDASEPIGWVLELGIAETTD